MKQLIKICFLLAVVVLAISCSKDERLMYEEDPRVYFYKSVRGSQSDADSIDFSFSALPDAEMTDTVYLWMRIMGSAVPKERVINIVADSGRAVAGYHYKLGPLVMPANAYETRIPVYLYRRPGLKDSIVSVMFSVQESADFKPGFPDNPGLSYRYDRLHYKVSITDRLVKPTNWESVWLGLFGAYSEVKFRFLIQATGKTSWNSYPLPQDQRFLVQTAKLALLEYEALNGYLYDENNNIVFFP
ncbi:DUF4843 domain-containing protein [Parasegetibacter sp. NRK P23]|uniref:DUF4843 domain-containing protein n=1 Tax=Parasegetibacter sp. NRK P23 TaxID=2942999 RepID=UPI0020432B76|nr:DUF4843 domain-containing protein [Parasegetibacter sp. NRK P23]MCM5528934.1 DUF4843 domain-containing protein [Parasegetibacter sp. NRK P23]